MKEFNFEQWLSKHTYWEDISTSLLFMTANKHGGIYIQDYEGHKYAEGKTLEEACNNYHNEMKKSYGKCRCEYNEQ